MSELIIYECPQTKNRCYIQAAPAKHVGILVHSTGAVNRELKRYVDDEDVLGRNQYGNHWNSPNTDKCMHAFIGYDKNDVVAVAHTLPYEYACWGCGKGKNGSYNYDPTAHIQFEICQGSNADAEYYRKAIAVAEAYSAELCRWYGFTARDIVSHCEAAKAGYASNHGDPESWMKRFGDDMDAFRARVAARLSDAPVTDTPPDAQSKTPPTPEPHQPVLVRGSSGEAVRRMQTLLMSHGFDLNRYGADGDFGAETDAAVRAFQQERELSADGVCGAMTWAKLLEPSALYTVRLTGVPERCADMLCARWPGAERELESGFSCLTQSDAKEGH